MRLVRNLMISSIDIEQGPVGVFLKRLRLGFAAIMLVLLIVIPVTATLEYGVLGVTREAVLPVWGFVLAMLPEMLREARALLRHKILLVTAIGLLLCAGVWLYHGYSPYEPRFRLMLGISLMFPAAIAWFRIMGDHGFLLAFLAKTGVLVYACLKFGAVIVQGMPAREVFLHPPIYRHVRHFNYDLALVTGLAGAAFAIRTQIGRLLWVLGFVCLGFFSFWSGGRGQFLAMGAMLMVLMASRRPKDDLKPVFWAVLAFLFGGLCVVLSGETDLLWSAFHRSTKDTLNGISSSRLAIWQGTLASAFSSVNGALFGYGPESFERMAIFRQFKQYILHPHNTLVQWFFEYGLIGAGLLLISTIFLTIKCILPSLFQGRGIERVCASTLIGMMVFSLVDGVFYHPAPLLFMTLMWAYLFARTTRSAS